MVMRFVIGTLVVTAALGCDLSSEEMGNILEDLDQATNHELEEDANDESEGHLAGDLEVQKAFESAEAAAKGGFGAAEGALKGGTRMNPLFREVVGLRIGGTTFCTGVTIARRFIVTAAHCLDQFVSGSSKWGNTTVRVRYADSSSERQVYNGNASFRIHPSWNGSGSVRDIALIRLGGNPSSYYRGRFHRSAAAPVDTHRVVGWQTSWGARDKNFGLLGFLSYDSVNGLVLVATSGKYPIPGDSGGAAMVRKSSGGTSRYITTGITSKGGPTGGFFARIGSNMGWLFSASMLLGDHLSCGKASLKGIPYYYSCH